LSGSELPWYAVRVRSQYEKCVSRALRERDYEEFLPMYWCRRQWSDRIKMLQLPLFAGYLFCRFDPSHRARILATPGVLLIAGVGKIPLPVDGAEIEAIRQAVNSPQHVEPFSHLAIGDTVRIEHGPLSGLQGVLLRFKGRSHLILRVQLLQRGVAVEIDESWVVACQTRPIYVRGELTMPPRQAPVTT
jgi:transcriptional antiterminator NusG